MKVMKSGGSDDKFLYLFGQAYDHSMSVANFLVDPVFYAENPKINLAKPIGAKVEYVKATKYHLAAVLSEFCEEDSPMPILKKLPHPVSVKGDIGVIVWRHPDMEVVEYETFLDVQVQKIEHHVRMRCPHCGSVHLITASTTQESAFESDDTLTGWLSSGLVKAESAFASKLAMGGTNTLFDQYFQTHQLSTSAYFGAGHQFGGTTIHCAYGAPNPAFKKIAHHLPPNPFQDPSVPYTKPQTKSESTPTPPESTDPGVSLSGLVGPDPDPEPVKYKSAHNTYISDEPGGDSNNIHEDVSEGGKASGKTTALKWYTGTPMSSDGGVLSQSIAKAIADDIDQKVFLEMLKQPSGGHLLPQDLMFSHAAQDKAGKTLSMKVLKDKFGKFLKHGQASGSPNLQQIPKGTLSLGPGEVFMGGKMMGKVSSLEITPSIIDDMEGSSDLDKYLKPYFTVSPEGFVDGWKMGDPVEFPLPDKQAKNYAIQAMGSAIVKAPGHYLWNPMQLTALKIDNSKTTWEELSVNGFLQAYTDQPWDVYKQGTGLSAHLMTHDQMTHDQIYKEILPHASAWWKNNFPFPSPISSFKEQIDGGYYVWDPVQLAAHFFQGKGSMTHLDMTPDEFHQSYLKHPCPVYKKMPYGKTHLMTEQEIEKEILMQSYQWYSTQFPKPVTLPKLFGVDWANSPDQTLMGKIDYENGTINVDLGGNFKFEILGDHTSKTPIPFKLKLPMPVDEGTPENLSEMENGKVKIVHVKKS